MIGFLMFIGWVILIVLCIISYVMYFSVIADDEIETTTQLFCGIIPFGMIVMFYIDKYKELKRTIEYEKRNP